jgi:ABC-2 type transport system permease protein
MCHSIFYLNGSFRIRRDKDASDPNHAKTLVNYASGVIAQSLMQESKANNPSSLINTELKLLYNPLMKSSYNFVPGVMGFIIIIVCAMMTSISIVRERERGSMELLLVSPVKPITIILSKVAPYFFISLINILTIFLVSYFIMGVPIKGSIFWIFLLCIVYILVSLSLGILVSTIAKTQLVALVISAIILLMPSMLLSGMMFDISSMPLILQAIAQVMPAKWFISAIRKLMIMGVDVRFVLNEFLVLFSMGVLLMLIMYSSAIFYYPERLMNSGYAWILKWNPLYCMIQSFRNAMFGEAMDMGLTAYAAVCSIVVLILGVICFYKKQDDFILQI